ncbi:MAG: hypothetical protein J5545_05715 [Bacteroidaceae bacterium]|nr:hypothetical protein [Bacteroidaceae bacterium]
MKKILLTSAAVLCCAFNMTVLTSCSVEDNPVNPTPAPQELADATIIWYGTGGGNVDPYILDDFRSIYRAQAANFERVNVVAQYKASLHPKVYKEHPYEEVVDWAEEMTANCSHEELEMADVVNYFYLCHPIAGASYRFAINPQKTLREQLLETQPYGEMNADFTCPDSLTNYINWAAQNYPAKKYILMLADHGGGFLPHHDTALPAQTRGLIFDDGYDKKCFSAKSFASAVRNASVRPDGIVTYLCLMNNMEFLYEVKDVTDYIAASTYVMWSGGASFGTLVDNLAEGKDTRTSLSNFVDACIDRWDEQYIDPENPDFPWYFDFTLTETSRLNDLAPVLREVTDRLVDTYQNGTPEQRAAIDECTANAVKVDNNYPFYDLAKYMESLFYMLPEVFDEDLYDRFATTFNACLAHQRYSKYLENHNYQVDYSMILAVGGNYVVYDYKQEDGQDPVLMGADVYYTDGTLKTFKYMGTADDSSDGSLEDYQLDRVSTWPGTFEGIYQQSTFDRLVGWSRWLLINQTPPPAWSPSSFFYRLPDDDMSDNPNV